jgi:hypothetical protein
VAAPIISLQVNGVPTPGLVELLDRDAEPTPTPVGPTPADPLELLRGPRVEVPVDVITEVWIDGAACAHRWFLGGYDPIAGEGFEIEQTALNETRDPRVASQNRFNLSLAFGPHRAVENDLQLFGAFEFEEVIAVAWWRIAVLPLQLPVAILRDGRTDAEIDLVAGCDLQLFLANGYEEHTSDCGRDLSAELGPATTVVVGEALSLELDGIPVDDLTIICGRPSDLDFIAEPQPGCREEARNGDSIPVPDAPGTWALALSTCASVGIGTTSVLNTLCGTWYASVQIVEASPVG